MKSAFEICVYSKEDTFPTFLICSDACFCVHVLVEELLYWITENLPRYCKMKSTDYGALFTYFSILSCNFADILWKKYFRLNFYPNLASINIQTIRHNIKFGVEYFSFLLSEIWLTMEDREL